MIRKGNKNHDREKTLKKIDMFFNGRNDAINFIEDYGSMILGARKKAAEEQDGKGFKIVTSKQMLQRLPIALARVKAGSNSENLLNETRLFVLCINQKKSLKKYTTT